MVLQNAKRYRRTFSDKELIRLRHDGRLCETDYVRKGSAEKRIVAKRVKGLFDTSQPIPPPPPVVSDPVHASQSTPPPPPVVSDPVRAWPWVPIAIFGGAAFVVSLVVIAMIGSSPSRPTSDLATVTDTSPTESSTMEAGQTAKPVEPFQLSPQDLFAKISPTVVRLVVRDEQFQTIGQGSGFFKHLPVCRSSAILRPTASDTKER